MKKRARPYRPDPLIVFTQLLLLTVAVEVMGMVEVEGDTAEEGMVTVEEDMEAATGKFLFKII